MPWSALFVGFIGGWAFMGVHLVMLKMRLDDPLDAVAVHGGGGEIFHTLYYLLLNEDLQTFVPCA